MGRVSIEPKYSSINMKKVIYDGVGTCQNDYVFDTISTWGFVCVKLLDCSVNVILGECPSGIKRFRVGGIRYSQRHQGWRKEGFC